MSHFLDDEWRGLEAEQPRPSRRWLVLGLVAAAFLLLVICGLSSLLFYQRTGRFPESPALEIPATEGPNVETITPGSVAGTAAPTELALAPTATLGAPVAAGNVNASLAGNSPAIDGDLAEWAGTVTDSTFQVFSAEGWDGTDDLGASWQLSWDTEYLYVAVTVSDDNHVQTQTGNQIFRGDSVDLQIDTDREGDYAPAVSPDDFQINLSPGDFAGLSPSAFRFQGTPSGSMVDAPGHSISVVARPTGQGYALEAAIPWRDLSVAPQPGLVLGLALNVSDNDVPGTAVQEVMKSHVPTRRFADPTSWGTLTLQEP
jgi:hypothetical protein